VVSLLPSWGRCLGEHDLSWANGGLSCNVFVPAGLEDVEVAASSRMRRAGAAASEGGATSSLW
jgi:hypothetical protein